jgi:tetratricopeptide (TPR) repeat protein
MREVSMTSSRFPGQGPGNVVERTLHCVFPCVGIGLVFVLLGAWADEARGQVQQHAGHPLGTVYFPISCSEQAQVEFNRAIVLLHHMTYPQAREAFEQVAATDPRCAMAHWGIAMTLFQPLWPTRPGRAELRRGWEAVQTARSLRPATERERLLVDVAAVFFREPDTPDYWPRIRRWEQALQRAYAAFPQDAEVAAFYALAHLAIAPAEEISRAHSDRAATILLDVYERNPDHPGAMHYLVHASDTPGRESELLEIVRKYETTAPRNPHALHMPTHIYTRLGDWDAVIQGNLRAAEAALEHPAGEGGQFVWDEFPHAIEYLIYAYLQKGADDEAASQLRRLHGTARLQPTFKTAFHLASTRARYALERRTWSEAMSLVPRDPPTLDWDRFPWPEAVTWFGRGMGAAREGRVEEARRARQRLEELETAASNAGEELFVRNIRILRLGVDAWLAHSARDAETSIALMRQAVDLEAATPKHAVTPGPTLPSHELLGDLLLEQGKPAEALAAYERSLALYPRRFNSLLGAARSARATGDEFRARTLYRELLEVAGEGTRTHALQEAQDYTGRLR